MVLKRGKVISKVIAKFCFLVDGTTIPSITEKPVKSLGKVFNCIDDRQVWITWEI